MYHRLSQPRHAGMSSVPEPPPPSGTDGCFPRLHVWQVGARERVEEDGAKWVNFIMTKPEIAKLAAAA